MANPHTVKEKLRFATLSAASFLGVLTLSSCGEGEPLSPHARYVSDYETMKNDCLGSSPYRSDNVLISRDELGIITVKPATGDLPPLKFNGYENTDQPLQPADHHTVSVLEDYGCKTKLGD